MAKFHPFLWLSNIPLCVCMCVYHIFFIHSSVDRYLGCFCILAIVNKAAMNIEVHVTFWISGRFFFLDLYQEWNCWVIRSDQISRSVVSDSLRPHESQHTRPPCPSPTPGVHWDSRPASQWCHPAISSSVIPFSSCPQSLPASESFSLSQLFTWGG